MKKASLFIAVAIAALLVVACSDDAGVREIGESRVTARLPKPAAPTATSGERFGYRPVEEHTHTHAAPATAPAAAPESAPPEHSAPYTWTAPDEWIALPASRFRQANFAIGDGAGECYLSVLPGTAGGIAANVNRWRAQLSLPPLDASTSAALPTRPLLGGEAVLVEFEGAFRGMEEEPAREGYALLGLMLEKDDRMVFVKMTGPAAMVRRERERFLAFCDSLREREGAPR